MGQDNSCVNKVDQNSYITSDAITLRALYTKMRLSEMTPRGFHQISPCMKSPIFYMYAPQNIYIYIYIYIEHSGSPATQEGLRNSVELRK